MADKFWSPNRREFIAGAAAAATLSALPVPALAAHKITLGDFEVTTFSDGHIPLPSDFPAPNAPATEREAAMQRAGYVGNPYKSPINVTLIKTPNDLILVDMGSGPRFVSTAGKLEASLGDAGVDPAEVTKVVVTHGHPDHLWGAVNDFDELSFPEAEYYVAEKEFAFWMGDDAMNSLPEDRKSFAVGAKSRFKAIEDKLKFVKEDDEIVSGLAVIETNGHTQGHISFELKSGSDSLVVLGDALTNSVISFEHPDWKPAADHVPDLAVATRKRLLDRLHHSKSKIIGYHLPPPGMGMVVKSGSGYAYEAIA